MPLCYPNRSFPSSFIPFIPSVTAQVDCYCGAPTEQSCHMVYIKDGRSDTKAKASADAKLRHT